MIKQVDQSPEAVCLRRYKALREEGYNHEFCNFAKVAAAEITRLRAEVGRLQKWQQDMVEITASGGRLDGYREFAAKVAVAENVCDDLRAEVERLRAALGNIEREATRYWREGEAAYQFAILACAALEGDTK